MIRGLYCICDTVTRPQMSHLELAQSYLAGGARIVQLRDKSNKPWPAARAIAKLKERHRFTLIINDHPDIAIEVGADGLHIGADDIPIIEARCLLGPAKLIGYSAHSLEEALRAAREGADYVAFGAIFPTQTKGPGHPIQGIEKLKEVVRALKIPVVAIGGINRETARRVIDAGASAFALISGLVNAPDIAAEVRWYESLSP